MRVRAISISQLVLNEIAWSPGDPGTGAPSFFGDRHRRPSAGGVDLSNKMRNKPRPSDLIQKRMWGSEKIALRQSPIALSQTSSHMETAGSPRQAG
jgi:hypothetical protein